MVAACASTKCVVVSGDCSHHVHGSYWSRRRPLQAGSSARRHPSGCSLRPYLKRSPWRLVTARIHAPSGTDDVLYATSSKPPVATNELYPVWGTRRQATSVVRRRIRPSVSRQVWPRPRYNAASSYCESRVGCRDTGGGHRTYRWP